LQWKSSNLARLKENPGTAVDLYAALPRASYWVLLEPGSEAQLSSASFLSYPSKDVGELPVFTSDKLPLFFRLKEQSGAAAAQIDGVSLFKRLLDVIESGKLELAINPGSPDGIRLTRAMLLSALAYSNGEPSAR
jgi:hypothetical protein